MTPDLKQYIETELLPTVGLIQEDTDAFTTVEELVVWLESSQTITMPISGQNLMDWLLLDNEGIIDKKRNFYLTYAEFDQFPAPLLGTEAHECLYKELLTYLILPTDLIEDGSFMYLTDDEFMIYKNFRE